MTPRTHIQFAGAQEKIISSLVSNGMFKTRSEAIRTAVLLLGEKYDLVK